MIGPTARRGFLRGLVSLPLIGGGVTLIGQPSAVAEPVTARLLREYHDWLMYEQHEISQEILAGRREPYGVPAVFGASYRWHRSRGPLRKGEPSGTTLGDGVSFASTRAALVLSAVGCDWREGSACA